MTGFIRAALCAAISMCVLVACGTKPAPDFRGRWRAVNTIDAEPRPIPLRPVHTFAVLPSDRTLKEVLDRWGRESQHRVIYRASMNYSIHLEATKVTAPNLGAALGQLESAYVAQGIDLTLQGQQIIVTGGLISHSPVASDGEG